MLFAEYNYSVQDEGDIATGYGMDGRGSTSGSVMIFLFSIASTPALGPTQPPIQWVPGSPSPGVKRHVRELNTHLHLVPRSRMVELNLNSAIRLLRIVVN
jgi:hypothetical protein